MGVELVLHPAMPASGDPEFEAAQWIGSVDLAELNPLPNIVVLEGSRPYSSCRILVRASRTILGLIELPVIDGTIDPDTLRLLVAELSPRAFESTNFAPMTVTVTVSTRNRGAQLKTALQSLAAMDDAEHVDFLIVDNASDDDATFRAVSELGDPRFRTLSEPRQGLAHGRNRALLESSADIVAFTDDDVVADREWIGALQAAFSRSADVALVTGMVATGELRTPAQQYFEHNTHWQTRPTPRTFRLADGASDIAAFPFDMSHFGTGANFAVRRDTAIRLGGFNEALGIGSPTHGGEDVDMFVRVLYAGWSLAYTPDALIWHRHRADRDALDRAVNGYSISFTAWITSLLENPLTRRDAVRVGGGYLTRRLRSLATATPAQYGVATMRFNLDEHGLGHLPRAGTRALARGPRAYVRSRKAGRQTRPLIGLRATGEHR